MTDAFAARLREATMTLPPEQVEQYRATVADLAASNRLNANTLLSLVRMAFTIEGSGDAAAREQLNEAARKRGATLPDRGDYLAAMLALVTLLERFARSLDAPKPGKRFNADASAALAIAVCANRGLTPVHPDLIAHAEHWRWAVAELIRLSPPTRMPALPASLSALDADESAATPPDSPASEQTPAVPLSTADQLEELRTYAVRLHRWLERSSAAARLDALDEQANLTWWLAKSRGDIDITQLLVTASFELADCCTAIPGPPAARELLHRRLGPGATDSVELEKVSESVMQVLRARVEQVPAAVADLCGISSGLSPSTETASAIEVAGWVYDEIQLMRVAASASEESAP